MLLNEVGRGGGGSIDRGSDTYRLLSHTSGLYKRVGMRPGPDPAFPGFRDIFWLSGSGFILSAE